MHELLFETMEEWGGKEDAVKRFEGYAAQLGLDTAAFAACLQSGVTAAQVQAELEQGEAVGVQGAPAFFVNDWFISGAQSFEVFGGVIERALRGEHPPPTPTPLPAGKTPFDVNPERPGYTYSGDVTLGSAEAELVLLELIDFQSPENRKYFSEVWPELKKKYIDPGKVRAVVKHFPAAEHAAAFKAAEAAECAALQGAFWAMHDLLFQQQEEWSRAEDVPTVLKGYMRQLGLDSDAFSTCLDEGQTGNKVEQDISIAQRNQLSAAPQFVLLMGEQGGVVPLDELQKTIDEVLAQ